MFKKLKEKILKECEGKYLLKIKKKEYMIFDGVKCKILK